MTMTTITDYAAYGLFIDFDGADYVLRRGVLKIARRHDEAAIRAKAEEIVERQRQLMA